MVFNILNIVLSDFSSSNHVRKDIWIIEFTAFIGILPGLSSPPLSN